MRRRASAVVSILLAAGTLTACQHGQSGQRHVEPPSSPAATGAPTTAAAGPTPTPPAPGSYPAQLAAYYTQHVVWRPCTAADGAAGKLVGDFQCARVAVPLDYSHPNGRRIDLLIGVHRATDPAHRIGSLLINPGGPGGSGMEYLASVTSQFPHEIRADFDMVGFDPRGTGGSAPVQCADDATLDRFIAANPFPTTPSDINDTVQQVKAFDAACQRNSGWELPYVGTANAARDMDVIRAVLGDRKLTYVGKSYGTLLGATYADWFPHNIRALVLDGAVDPTVPTAQSALQQGQGFETDLTDFFADCAHQSDCPFTGSPQEMRAQLAALLDQIDRTPIEAPNAAHGPLHVGEAFSGISTALYDTDYWKYLRIALAQAKQGDGSVLMRLSDAMNERDDNGHYGSLIPAFNAIECADNPTRYSLAQVEQFAGQWRGSAQFYGPQEAWGLLNCSLWPVHTNAQSHPLRAAGAPPIVVIGTTHDPATPYEWAQGLAKQLSSAVLLTHTGDGHTVYGDGKSPCIDTAVDAYLLRLTPPAKGTTCS